MDIDQARTFLAIATRGSFLEAARRRYVTRSTVSARIHNLGEELGVRLFVLTAPGPVSRRPGNASCSTP